MTGDVFPSGAGSAPANARMVWGFAQVESRKRCAARYMSGQSMALIAMAAGASEGQR